MKKLISLTFFLVAFASAFAQDYSYSFSGTLDQQSLDLLERNCAQVTEISSAKVKYKAEAQKGEILLFVAIKANQRAEADGQFAPADIKQVILAAGLTPGDFRSIKH